MSMIFHELATNAVKYGALSVPTGAVHVTWLVNDGPKNRSFLNCEWREENGPPVTPPERTGYGTVLMRVTSAQAGGTVELMYDQRGLIAMIKIPV
ncbi:sensor histidine kinase [Pseudorhizobium xiangyangii]|uniref:sensor histidine kinase n=1 Tax=Pseudorhizobium xiangyangii TaxID=2883104 RepID=UPI0028F44C5D|nr:sensor histidine kinase [Neorhizobium xiangyangii]